MTRHSPLHIQNFSLPSLSKPARRIGGRGWGSSLTASLLLAVLGVGKPWNKQKTTSFEVVLGHFRRLAKLLFFVFQSKSQNHHRGVLFSSVFSVEKSRQGQQHKDKSQNSQRKDYKQRIRHVYPFKFNSLRLAIQKTRAVAAPINTGMIRKPSSNEGRMTDATEISPKSAHISASFSNCKSESFTNLEYAIPLVLSI